MNGIPMGFPTPMHTSKSKRCSSGLSLVLGLSQLVFVTAGEFVNDLNVSVRT